MKRFKLLLILTAIGLFSVYQVLPIGDYCFGLTNGLILFGSISLYLVIFSYEIYLNLKEKKNEKKDFDKSSLIITGGLILIFLITQNLNIFESKIILLAKTQDRYSSELRLKKNSNFTLVKYGMDSDCYYKGIYSIKNDTLHLFGNTQNIDTIYFIDNKTNKLISINDFKPMFVIKKISKNQASD